MEGDQPSRSLHRLNGNQRNGSHFWNLGGKQNEGISRGTQSWGQPPKDGVIQTLDRGSHLLAQQHGCSRQTTVKFRTSLWDLPLSTQRLLFVSNIWGGLCLHQPRGTFWGQRNSPPFTWGLYARPQNKEKKQHTTESILWGNPYIPLGGTKYLRFQLV